MFVADEVWMMSGSVDHSRSYLGVAVTERTDEDQDLKRELKGRIKTNI